MERIPVEIRNFILFPVIFIGHIFYEFGVGYWLFKLAGEIKESQYGDWIKIGGIDWAFETPIYITGSYYLSKANVGICAWEGEGWGVLFILIGSLLTALATSQIIQKKLDNKSNKFGKFKWRLIVALLGWIFIPLPERMTLIYTFTLC